MAVTETVSDNLKEIKVGEIFMMTNVIFNNPFSNCPGHIT